MVYAIYFMLLVKNYTKSLDYLFITDWRTYSIILSFFFMRKHRVLFDIMHAGIIFCLDLLYIYASLSAISLKPTTKAKSQLKLNKNKTWAQTILKKEFYQKSRPFFEVNRKFILFEKNLEKVALNSPDNQSKKERFANFNICTNNCKKHKRCWNNQYRCLLFCLSAKMHSSFKHF